MINIPGISEKELKNRIIQFLKQYTYPVAALAIANDIKRHYQLNMRLTPHYDVFLNDVEDMLYRMAHYHEIDRTTNYINGMHTYSPLSFKKLWGRYQRINAISKE